MYVTENCNKTDRNQTRRLSTTEPVRHERVYTYEEAIDQVGTGLYTLMLLAVLSISALSMTVDIFGISIVVTGAQCDLNIGVFETSIILSVTFIGPILMSYTWGCIADMYGRRKSLIIAMWSCFFVSIAGAFSPDWITLAVVKLISTGLSSCAQSITFILLGESCPKRHRDKFMIILSSISDLNTVIYTVIAYFILQLDFSYNMGFINFVPWRLLSIALTLFKGFGALGVLFCFESPKFLLNLDKHDGALHALARIWKINRNNSQFHVNQIILNETGNSQLREDMKNSLWKQIVPIFKPPLLWRSLQLMFLNAVIYGTNNNFLMWLPFLGQQFVDYTNSNETDNNANVCYMIESNEVSNTTGITCISSVDQTVMWFVIAQAGGYALLVVLLSWVAHRKRILIITICLVSGFSCVGAVLIDDRTTSFILYLVVVMNQVITGSVYSYFVDLFPTACRGMAACLGTMVARLSALVAVFVFGNLLESHCSQAFYVAGVALLCGVVVGVFLPPDKIRTKDNK